MLTTPLSGAQHDVVVSYPSARLLLSVRNETSSPANFHWTAPKVVLSIFLFLVAGLAEIGGGWLVWQAVRGGIAERWWRSPRALGTAALGGLVLIVYGFLPTAQPPPTFGRLYAVYGGFFIVLSFLWGWVVDKERPDRGDCIGAVIALAGVALAWFWPRTV